LSKQRQQQTVDRLVSYTKDDTVVDPYANVSLTKKVVHGSWYRGDTINFRFREEQLRKSDEPIREFYVHGWEPHRAFVDKNTPIFVMGSCFATHLAERLRDRGYNLVGAKSDSLMTFVSAGVNNTFAMRQFFEWVDSGIVPEGAKWNTERAAALKLDRDLRKKAREFLSRAKLFVLTLGLSEIWEDKRTGTVFWRGILKDQFDPSVHRFRVSSVDENRENIRVIFETIKKISPKSKVVFTLSPVPLIATFRPISCTTANSVSKAVLRVAIDEALRDLNVHGRKDLHYWPSYEIVLDYFRSPFNSDCRYFPDEILNQVMDVFETVYFTTP